MRNTPKTNRLWILTLLFLGQNFLLSGQANLDSLAAAQEIDSLMKRSLVVFDERKHAEAMQIITAAAEKSEAFFGKIHPTHAAALGQKGRMFINQKKYAEAEPILLEALALREKISGKNNVAYATLLSNAGITYHNLAKYARAEEALLEGRNIMEDLENGNQQQIYTSILINLGALYIVIGQFEKAESVLLRGKNNLEANNKTEIVSYQTILLSLGRVYRKIGNHKNAIQFLEQAAALAKKHDRANTEAFGSILNGIGAVYFSIRDLENAKKWFLETKTVFEKTVGKESHSYATVLHNLGRIYLKTNNLDSAALYLDEAVLLMQKIGTSAEENYFQAMSGLALMNMQKKNYAVAAEKFREILSGVEKSKGCENSMFSVNARFLFESYLRSGQIEAADSIFLLLSPIERKLLRRASAHFSPQELGGFLETIFGVSTFLGSLCMAKIGHPENRAAEFFDEALFTKGYLLQSVQHLNSLAANADDAQKAVFLNWKNVQKQLADAYTLPISERKNVDSLENQSIDLEKNLIQNLPNFSESLRDVHWQEVQTSLKNGEAAIEFVHFEALLSESKNTFYAALVILPDSKTPQFVPLFEENELLKLTNRSTSWLQDYVERIYAFRQAGGSKNLFQLIFQPLEKLLNSPSGVGGQTKTIYFSPSGLLHRLNLEAIQTKNGKTLADQFQFVPLGSTRQLVVPQYFTKIENQAAVIFGGIKYEADSTSIFQGNTNLVVSRNAEGSRGFNFSQADSTLRGNVWKYLPATETEAQNIDNQLKMAGFQTQKMTGFAASEEVLKMVGSHNISPKILHIATHGFFFPDPKTVDGGRAAADAARPPSEPIFKVSENPMIRSGLVLAGANQAWKTGKPIRPDVEDGILTALEISQLNLSNTELVVLSACETGLGDIAGNEGVYGLQRAFKIAGAKYLIMSLWKVDDKKTSEMMTLFYEKWLGEKLPLPDAFRAAQKTIREKYPNPFFWAGFVLVE